MEGKREGGGRERQGLKERPRNIQRDDGTYRAWHGISKPGTAEWNTCRDVAHIGRLSKCHHS